MYLKSLTLRGFKSFASATTMSFEPGITCIVGPNGSGKSNVVDALTWVMGEQGAKSLRGGKMEDVIFAGTASRAALGRAEVSLTIDNTDGALPIEYTEVTLTRTMFRSGGSEYAINGHPARLLDVQELLSDAGIGREMHVIVGQGQLDEILQATPETRRAFIEEAAGVLKHRKRKEKALRKLESTQANLDRLNDLLTEIRRQLKPLGRQAEVARKAATVQAERRDARARLLADDYVMASLALESELAAQADLRQQRIDVEASLNRARTAEAEAERAVAEASPRVAGAQETWYALAALRERASSTLTIASERVRHASASVQDERHGRDPEQLEAEAADVAAQEKSLADEVDARAQDLEAATAQLRASEASHRAADADYTAQVRAIADRREGLARLTGEANTLRSRVEASADEIARLEESRAQAQERARNAQERLESLALAIDDARTTVFELETAQSQAEATRAAASERLESLRAQERTASQERAGLAARVEALASNLDRADASATLASSRRPGVVGALTDLIRVEPGFEQAISTALREFADGVVLDGPVAALDAFASLRDADLGRAQALLAGAEDPATPEPLPGGARWASSLVTPDPRVASSVGRLVDGVAVVADLDAARALVAERPEVIAVTMTGDTLSAWMASGGSTAKPSVLAVTAQLEQARASLAEVTARASELQALISDAKADLDAAGAALHAARSRVKDATASANAVANEAEMYKVSISAVGGEEQRVEASIERVRATRAENEEKLAGVLARVERASELAETGEPDASERDRWAHVESEHRQAEMEAGLALRTAQERARALAGRADSLQRAAHAERLAREKAAARREQLRREGEVGKAAAAAATWLLTRIDASSALADARRKEAEASRLEAERRLADARRATRDLSAQLERLMDSVHRDDLARAEQSMRVEALATRAMDELGLSADVLASEFGPDVPIPVLTSVDGSPTGEDDELATVPYVRAEQEKRLRAAERTLASLGRINPLALEEYEAAQERHAFLAAQLDDLRKTRADLIDIIDQVDARVEEVFAAAYADVEAAFAETFARLFPGGEGRLVLTEPGNWLTTGVDVEARPAGKKVKRLSLLSGGERSLVAVAFLVALFKARPSPFYIMDEVEAALDDVNLTRLLDIYEELHQTSQLLIITHQKRTMEIADALYGVTMAEDGVSSVISQRLHVDD